MALIKCKDCEKEFSTDAKKCPNCGARRPLGKFTKWLLIGFVILVIIPSLVDSLFATNSLNSPNPVIKQPLIPIPKESINWPAKPEIPSLEREVYMQAYFSNKDNLTPQIIGYSNLPNETQIMVSLNRDDIDYSSETSTIVSDGKFETAIFNADGLKLPPGKYTVNISLWEPASQAEKVKKIIGNKGENLKGKHTRKILSGRTIDYSTRLALGSGPSKEVEESYRQMQESKKLQEQAERESLIPTAQYACQKFVKQQLNDPDSAEFNNASSYPASVKGNVYSVEVSGRARNGFNALRYVTFRCEAVYMGNDHWVPASIKQISN